MEFFLNSEGRSIVLNIIDAVKSNKAYLSDIDGLIGDGDHGINMNKGFSIAESRISSDDSFHTAMKKLGDTLILEIGGSMGPIYGTFFRTCALATKDKEQITLSVFSDMIERVCDKIKSLGGARVGDKTLIDTLEPTSVSLKESQTNNDSFESAVAMAVQAAERGKDSTKNLVAKIGRAARLGERSRGVLDAGAASCYIILKAMMDSVAENLICEN